MKRNPLRMPVCDHDECSKVKCSRVSAPADSYAAQRQYIVTLTAEINVRGFDSDDAVQAPFVSELYRRLRIDGWEVSIEAKSHN